MTGPWKPYSQIIDLKKMWRAGRQLDLNQPLHGGNIEYYGGYIPDREAVEALCNELNVKESKGVTE